MGLNITQANTFNFENREELKNAAKNILTKKGSSEETAQKFIEETIFDDVEFKTPQRDVYMSSIQLTLNNSLKETLKYLKTQSFKKQAKKRILGELWETFETTESYATPIDNDIIEFTIDDKAVNIFAA